MSELKTEEKRIYPLQFTGSGGEYFRIWIVNLALTLLTLGIYSAWAKVRRKRYFNNHTLLDGHPFDYLADPVAILKGRAIAFVCLLVYLLAQSFLPLISALLLLLFFVVTPWIVVRALQFNARNSSHRGLRFDFQGSLAESYIVFLGFAVLSMLTFGLAAPYLFYRKTAFIAGNHVYGNLHSSFHGRVWPFYRIFLVSIGILLGSVFLVLVGLIAVEGMPSFTNSAGIGALMLYLMGGLLAFYAVLPIVAGYFSARLAQQTFLGTQFGDLGFESRHRARGLIWLYVSNVILIALTLGIFIPWAQVRSARFWIDNLGVIGPAQGLDNVVAAAGQGLSATGSEMADVFDVDLGVG